MYLGLYLGTSSLKGLLVSKDHELTGSSDVSYGIENFATGCSEQYPNNWINAFEIVMKSFYNRLQSQLLAPRKIGISGQVHVVTMLYADGAVVKSFIIGNERRYLKEAKKMDDIAGFVELSGNNVGPGFAAPKISAINKNEFNDFKKIAKVLILKDYLRFWLNIIANIFNHLLILPKKGALGVASLALNADLGTLVRESITQPGVDQVIEPHLSFVTIYDGTFQVFRNICPSVKEFK